MRSNSYSRDAKRLLETQVAGEQRSFAPVQLTHRQLECLYWVQHGKSATDIGQILGLSRRTVENHLAKVCGQLGVRTRVQAVLKVRDLGLLSDLTS